MLLLILLLLLLLLLLQANIEGIDDGAPSSHGGEIAAGQGEGE